VKIYEATKMDLIDDIIDLFYEYGRARFIGNGECEVYIDD